MVSPELHRRLCTAFRDLLRRNNNSTIRPLLPLYAGDDATGIYNRSISVEEPYEIEARGAAEGINPHAKQMLDTFKGQGGLLIDDCQVQHLDISWIDIPFGAHFEVEFKAGPDDFLPLPLKLFEMSDGLFYPISTRVWTQKGLIEASTEILSFQANIPAELTQTKKAFRHKLRLSGVPQFRAFQAHNTCRRSLWASIVAEWSIPGTNLYLGRHGQVTGELIYKWPRGHVSNPTARQIF